MSDVIGLKNKGRVILAADKQASKGGSKDHSAIKVFEIKGCPGLIVGSVGRLKMLQILRFASNIVNLNSFNFIDPEARLTEEYMVNEFAPTLLAISKEAGCIITHENDPSGIDDTMTNNFLVAYKDDLFEVGTDGSVTVIDDYVAIGSGEDTAESFLAGYSHDAESLDDIDPFRAVVGAIDRTAYKTLFVDDGVDFVVTEDRDDDFIQQAAAIAGVTVEEMSEQIKAQTKSFTRQAAEENVKQLKVAYDAAVKQIENFEKADTTEKAKKIKSLEKELSKLKSELDSDSKKASKKSIFNFDKKAKKQQLNEDVKDPE